MQWCNYSKIPALGTKTKLRQLTNCRTILTSIFICSCSLLVVKTVLSPKCQCYSSKVVCCLISSFAHSFALFAIVIVPYD